MTDVTSISDANLRNKRAFLHCLQYFLNFKFKNKFNNSSLLFHFYTVIFYNLFKDKCGPGEFSVTGLSPCSPCAKSTYQSNSMSTSCIQCPTGLTTEFQGSRDVQNCTGMYLDNK